MSIQGGRIFFLKRCKTVQTTSLYRQLPRPFPENNALYPAYLMNNPGVIKRWNSVSYSYTLTDNIALVTVNGVVIAFDSVA